MKTVCRVLGVARSHVYELHDRSEDWRDGRKGRAPAGDAQLLAEIRQQISDLPSYGYRRACALVNRQRNTTVTYGDNTSARASLQVNRKLSANGRNVTLRLQGNYNDADAKTFSTQDLQYYQLLDAMGHDPIVLDELIARTGWSAAELAAKLLDLELAGRIERLPGQRFQRIARA